MMNGTCKKKPIKSAEILCVGTELLLGDIVNTNAAYLSRALAQLGIPVYHQTVVGDNPKRLMKAL
jgi:nicotinamide-nucleotide amidase